MFKKYNSPASFPCEPLPVFYSNQTRTPLVYLYIAYNYQLMNLTSQHPYWSLKNGILHAYPSLDKDLKTEIAVMGGGITGALVAWHLAQAGFDVAVFDKRDIGTGSTSASTALLQYEIDEPLHTLVKKVGLKRARESYLACYQAINDLKTLVGKEKLEVDFEKKPSLQYASFRKDVEELKEEARNRECIGIESRLMEPEELEDKFHIRAPGALYSEHGAQVDPYKLAHALLGSGKENLKVFDKTEIISVEPNRKNVHLVTDDDCKITASRLVIASGYESQNYIPYKIVALNSTYAIISEICEGNELWHENALIWETKVPYLYMRVTGDNRILIGGRDDNFYTPEKRNSLLAQKARQLKNDFNELMPHLPFKTDFQWAGTFGETTDSLPYIGSIPQLPNTFFALGFGGNGITFSLIGAQVIRDCLLGKKHPYKETFSFNR